MLPWSSKLYAGLSELHLDFSDCDVLVEISEEELLGILEGSPQLKRMTLLQLNLEVSIAGGHLQHTSARILKFPDLALLVLDCSPLLVGYILAHFDIPAIDLLEIRSIVSLWDIDRVPGHFFPDDRLPNRLFPHPPVFEVWPDDGGGAFDSYTVRIGSCHLGFGFDTHEFDVTSKAVMQCVLPLVPPSVTDLKVACLNVGREDWVKFFESHPEVRSIECSGSWWKDPSTSLCEALSPTGAEGITLCPKLESILLSGNALASPLADCLLRRKAAGYNLKYLKLLLYVDDRLAEELSLLVDVLEVVNMPSREIRNVGSIPSG